MHHGERVHYFGSLHDFGPVSSCSYCDHLCRHCFAFRAGQRIIGIMTTLTQTDDAIVDRIEAAGERIKRVQKAASAVIFGQEQVIERTLVTILSGGHALLIGVPGLAKTLLVETLGKILGLDAKRIQFTPDLMPSDIIGSEVLEDSTAGRRSFRFVKGPIFAQLLMADEINRASPKTQSALLQAMQEHHVTVAGQDRKSVV